MEHIRPYTITASYQGKIMAQIDGTGTEEAFKIAKRNFRDNLKHFGTLYDHIQIIIGERVY